jgi:sugar phosphate isomerase/epimerase
MNEPTRRAFLGSALAGGAFALSGRLPAIEPIQRTDKPHIKLSLAAYSFNRYMALKGKNPPTMTMDDFADFAVGISLDAIEPTAYYFADTSGPALAKFRGRCTRLGLDISGTAIGNDFCKQDYNAHRDQILHVKNWVENAAVLGAKTVRIFAGSVPKGADEAKVRQQVVEAIDECCDYAGKGGIYLALENHGGLTATLDQILAIVKAVKSPWFGVNLDTGNFQTDDPYGDLAKLAPYAVVCQLKTEIHAKGKPKEEADLKRLLDVLRGVNYRGYVALEYEAAEDPRTAVPKAIEALRKLL